MADRSHAQRPSRLPLFHFFSPTLFLFIIVSVVNIHFVDCQFNEQLRVEEYNKRGYNWPYPMETYKPKTEGWKRLVDNRYDQLLHAVNSTEQKWQGFLVNTVSGIIVPNFTQTGWGLTRAPDDVLLALQEGIRDGIHNNEHYLETENPAIVVGPYRPLFIDRPDLTKMVLHRLHPIVEAWTKMKLKPFMAYGLRLYQDQSQLLMHIDKTDTHVISFILHINSSIDAQAWPIVIEDYEGNTNEVIMEPGDMLLYESAKCFHGRPHKFHGAWYSSIFVHYYPADPSWHQTNYPYEGAVAVPPQWNQIDADNDSAASKKQQLNDLEIIGNGFYEPHCLHGWCNLKDSIKINGPGEEGYVLTTGGIKYPLYDNNVRDTSSTSSEL